MNILLWKIAAHALYKDKNPFFTKPPPPKPTNALLLPFIYLLHNTFKAGSPYFFITLFIYLSHHAKICVLDFEDKLQVYCYFYWSYWGSRLVLFANEAESLGCCCCCGVEKRDKLLLTLLIKKLEIKLEYFFPYWHLLNGGLSALFCLMLSQ